MQVMRKYRYRDGNYWVSVLKNAAYAPTFAEFEKHMEKILSNLKEADKFIRDSKPETWANSLFQGDRWGIVNNNIAESWNSWIKDARSMPPLAMVDTIRMQTMKMMSEKREEGARMTGALCPTPDNILQKNCMEGRDVTVLEASDTAFEVFDVDKRCVVDVEKRTCTCGK